jgi:Cu/Ag efflux protein CusF
MKKATATILSLMLVFVMTSISFAAEKKAAAKHTVGNVAAVDETAKTITVKGKKHEVMVSVNDKTKIMAGKDAKTLADVKTGETVSVKYKEENGKNIAESVDIHSGKKQETAPVMEKK